jgi:argininosuccinate lyase
MTANKLWGGRFGRGPAAIMEAINVSIDFDKRLAAHDLKGSQAHAAMLAAKGIIARADANAIRRGLATISREIENGKFPFRREFEDIHLNVEARLSELIGDAAGRLHTARSRNDQVRPICTLGAEAWASFGFSLCNGPLQQAAHVPVYHPGSRIRRRNP